MAYFTKDEYERKREYAYKVSMASEDLLAEIVTLIQIGCISSPKEYYENCKAHNGSFDIGDNEELWDKYDKLYPSVFADMEIISELSHKRHEIHSTNRVCFMRADDMEMKDLYYTCGGYGKLYTFDNGMECESLCACVNKINQKYNLVENIDVYAINVETTPPVTLGYDSNEEIIDYYDYDLKEEDKGDEDAMYNIAYELLYNDWNDIIDEWSSKVREWFKELNYIYGTNYPD